MTTPDSSRRALEQWAAEADAATARGDEVAAVTAWGRILSTDPNHVPTLTAIGQFSVAKRDFASARRAFQRVVDLGNAQLPHWMNLALACRALKDDAAEAHALTQALTKEPRDLLALLMKAANFERAGDRHSAARAYGAAVDVAPPEAGLPPELREPVRKATEHARKYNDEFAGAVDRFIDQHRDEIGPAGLDRFQLSLDILFGRKKRYDSQPMGYFFPGLKPTEFFDRKLFPWLDGIEASTAAIRQEFEAVLAEDRGFTPYLTYGSDQPLDQWAELNNSLRWSAFHLIKGGVRVPANADRCPRTMQALVDAPQPTQLGRTPVALFSMLKPRTRIPPHVGVSNARLLVHLPLIVPPHCRYRVGNEIRLWEPGKAWVFDDTIEHEAWNDSDQLRVVMIFDIWHPHLNESERRMVSLLARAQESFQGQAGDYGA